MLNDNFFKEIFLLVLGELFQRRGFLEQWRDWQCKGGAFRVGGRVFLGREKGFLLSFSILSKFLLHLFPLHIDILPLDVLVWFSVWFKDKTKPNRNKIGLKISNPNETKPIFFNVPKSKLQPNQYFLVVTYCLRLRRERSKKPNLPTYVVGALGF